MRAREGLWVTLRFEVQLLLLKKGERYRKKRLLEELRIEIKDFSVYSFRCLKVSQLVGKC